MKLRIIVSLILLSASAFGACTGSSPNWTSTPDQASVQTCVTNATNGDTITLSSGSATYASTVTISGKGVKIIVTSGGTVTLTSSTSSSPAFFTLSNTGSNFVRISGQINGSDCKTNQAGCGLILNRSNDAGFNSSAIQMQGPVLAFRIDHVQGNKGDAFLYSNNSSAATGDVYGVVDHYYLINYGRAYFAQDQRNTDGTFGLGCPGGTNGETSWHEFLGHQLSYAGTGNLIDFEDGQFNWTAAPASPGQGAFYSQYGGRVLIRYNLVNGWSPYIIDESDNPACGSVFYEVYNNTFSEDCTLTGFGCEGKVFDIRSGNFLIHDNAFVSSDIPIELITYPNGAGSHVNGHDPMGYEWNDTWNSGSGPQACKSDSNPSGVLCVDVDVSSQAPIPTRITGAPSGNCPNAFNGVTGPSGIASCYFLRAPTNASDPFFGYAPYTYPNPLIGTTPPVTSGQLGNGAKIINGAIIK